MTQTISEVREAVRVEIAKRLDRGAFGFCHMRGGKVIDDWCDPERHDAALAGADEILALAATIL